MTRETEPDHVILPARRQGKALAMQMRENAWLRQNPKGTILRCRINGNVIVERYAGSNKSPELDAAARSGIEGSFETLEDSHERLRDQVKNRTTGNG